MTHALVSLTVLAALVAGCAPRPSTPRSAALPAIERDLTVTGRHFAYGLHLAPQPNLVYHLDCISGAVVCAKPIFREHWVTLGLDADDEAALTAWKTLRTRHGGELKRVDVAPARSPLLGPTGAFDLAERQRLAGLLPRTPIAYEASVALLSTDEDARRLRVLLARFEPRFTAWWRTHGFAGGSASFDGFARRLADPFLDTTIERAARFYEADAPAGPLLDVHLIVQPPSRRRLSAAYQLESYAIVEVPYGAPPDALLGVVAHEAFHSFFGRMRPDARAALLARVTASEDPYSAVSFGLFDESIAATLGNGVVGRHYDSPESFARRLARDDGLDRYREAGVIARAMLPSMEGFLERGTTASSDEFIGAFLAAARSTYPNGRPRPLDYLHSPLLVADPRFAEASERLRDATHAGFPNLREYASFDVEAKTFAIDRPLLSVALLLPVEVGAPALEALSAPPKHRAALGAVAARSRGFVYALPRTPKSYAFVFAADDAPTMNELVGRFVALASVREGVLVELSDG